MFRNGHTWPETHRIKWNMEKGTPQSDITSHLMHVREVVHTTTYYLRCHKTKQHRLDTLPPYRDASGRFNLNTTWYPTISLGDQVQNMYKYTNPTKGGTLWSFLLLHYPIFQKEFIYSNIGGTLDLIRAFPSSLLQALMLGHCGIIRVAKHNINSSNLEVLIWLDIDFMIFVGI